MVNISYSGLMEPGGFLRAIYDLGIGNNLFPCLLFVGIGAMCDFGALIERPWVLIFAAAGQLGIFIALLCALLIGFNPLEACGIGIIGAMDGPTRARNSGRSNFNVCPSSVRFIATSRMDLSAENTFLMVPSSRQVTH